MTSANNDRDLIFTAGFMVTPHHFSGLVTHWPVGDLRAPDELLSLGLLQSGHLIGYMCVPATAFPNESFWYSDDWKKVKYR